jgi:hypothetical protein
VQITVRKKANDKRLGDLTAISADENSLVGSPPKRAPDHHANQFYCIEYTVRDFVGISPLLVPGQCPYQLVDVVAGESRYKPEIEPKTGRENSRPVILKCLSSQILNWYHNTVPDRH